MVMCLGNELLAGSPQKRLGKTLLGLLQVSKCVRLPSASRNSIHHSSKLIFFVQSSKLKLISFFIYGYRSNT